MIRRPPRSTLFPYHDALPISRYLHSTGQLHKGGPNTGLFLVVTADDAEDAAVPEMGTTFGRLKRAQARGDVRALLARGRRVAHVHLARPEDVSGVTPVRARPA